MPINLSMKYKFIIIFKNQISMLKSSEKIWKYSRLVFTITSLAVCKILQKLLSHYTMTV